MFEIGFRTHDFGKFDSVSSLADAIAKIKTPAVVQFALAKAIPSAPSWKDWDEEYIRTLRDTLSSRGITIVVSSGYINPVHPDPEERKNQVRRFCRMCELSDAFGCHVVGTETGTWNPKTAYTPDTFEPEVFDILLSSVEQMLNAAVKYNCTVALEPVAFKHTMCSVERTMRVMEKFNDEHLRIIFDPVNLIPQTGIPEKDGSSRRRPSTEAQRAFYRPALEAFRDYLVAIHAKDFILTEDGYKKGDLPILTGVFAWEEFFKDLRACDVNVPILLENHNPATLTETLALLNKF